VHEFTKVELFAWCAPDPEPSGEGEGEAWYDAGLELRCPDPGAHAYVNAKVETTTAAAAPLPRYLRTPSTGSTTTQSATLFQQMLALQLAIHRPLGLTLRTLLLPAHDLGASAALKVDVEALFRGSGSGGGDGAARWGEICSLALCADYQARRLGVRVEGSRDSGKAGGGAGLPFAWSLNGTALAVPRVWAALVEQGWDEARGVVRLPECLWGLMGRREIGRE
jgi:seryl-tRNA synthetase